MEWEQRLMDHAALHEGLVAKFQIAATGCRSDHWWRALDSGRWEALSPRVLALRGAPATDAQRVLAAVLDVGPGGFLHGPTTLAWLGLRGYDLRSLQVARWRGLHPLAPNLARLHRLRALRPHDVIIVRGVATETALRALWSEAGRYATPALADIGVERIGRLLDDAHRRKLTTWAALHEMVDDIHQRGRRGTTIMRALAEARPPGSSPTESRNETQLEKILADVGAPPLRRQPVLGGHEPIGRTDHRDAVLPLAIEVNSLLYHTAPSDQAADERRYQALNDAGFTVGVIWEDDLWSRPRGAAETVAEARRRAAAGDRLVIHSPGCPWTGNHLVLGTRSGR